MSKRSRSGSGGRGRRTPRRTASSAAPPIDVFDDEWFGAFRERSPNRYVDLTDIEDRRRYAPERYDTWPQDRSVYSPRSPRILVVPKGHRLARHQTYGGRYTLADIQRKRKISSKWYGVSKSWLPSQWRYGAVRAYKRAEVSWRLGYALPWQVIVCVRRERRRQVFHALRLAGRSGQSRGKRYKRSPTSEIRC